MAVENNEARIFGVRPAGDASAFFVDGYAGAEFRVYRELPDSVVQVAAYESTQTVTEIVYTVTAAKTLYLCTLNINMRNQSDKTNQGIVGVRNDSDVNQYIFVVCWIPPQNSQFMPVAFNPPLEIAAGWDIYNQSAATGLWLNTFVHGYEK